MVVVGSMGLAMTHWREREAAVSHSCNHVKRAVVAVDQA
jgi:hypothetical protein